VMHDVSGCRFGTCDRSSRGPVAFALGAGAPLDREKCKSVAKQNMAAMNGSVGRNQWRAWYVINDMNLDDKQALALMEALFVESGFHNWRNPKVPSSDHYPNDGVPSTGGDLDSVGVLQQRVRYDGAGRGWGNVSQAMDPEHAMREFAKRAKGAKADTAGRLAQKVQRSAYPTRYDQQEPQAHDLIYRMSRSCTR
jgi:hypothetical protein